MISWEIRKAENGWLVHESTHEPGISGRLWVADSNDNLAVLIKKLADSITSKPKK